MIQLLIQLSSHLWHKFRDVKNPANLYKDCKLSVTVSIYAHPHPPQSTFLIFRSYTMVFSTMVSHRNVAMKENTVNHGSLELHHSRHKNNPVYSSFSRKTFLRIAMDISSSTHQLRTLSSSSLLSRCL